jgi:NADH:ubiquinone oxidoreductase subunit E
LVRDAGLDAQVELAGAFCMEHCSMGISVRVGDRVYSGLLAQDAERFFAENVLSRVAAQEGNSAGAIACLPR